MLNWYCTERYIFVLMNSNDLKTYNFDKKKSHILHVMLNNGMAPRVADNRLSSFKEIYHARNVYHGPW